jgi:signal transduction histidine kinase/PAS domain-containing protein
VLSAGADDVVLKPVDAATLGIRLDIAERRLREGRDLTSASDRLESKTVEMETLFNNVPDVFFSVDVTEERLIQISPAAKRVFGTDPRDLVGKDAAWRRVLFPPSGDENPWEDLRNNEPGGPLVREYGIQHSERGARWVRASVQIHRDDVSGHVPADGVVVDLTHKQGSRKGFAARNRELATLYTLVELTLSATSLDEAYGQILDLVSEVMGCSIVAIEHYDRDREKLVLTAAKGLPAFGGTPLEIPQHKTLSGIVVKSGVPVRESDPVSRTEHADERLLALHLSTYAAFPLKSAGSVFGTLMLADTEAVEFDERFSRMGMVLATAVATYVERMEVEAAMRQSEQLHQEMAIELQQANSDLESFAYSVSHDVRTPLRTMQGFAHALLQNHSDQLPEEARDYVNRIVASGRQSENLISDLLTYSRLSFEPLEIVPVDLQTVVDSARDQIQGNLDERNAKLTVEGPLSAGVRGSLTALVQIVANLLANAVKFVPHDQTPEIRIRSEEREGAIRLWVEDNGVGIPEGHEERIFRVFERLTESGDRPGTGIGLAIVKRGLQRIGGNCGVEQRPEGGSAFWIDVRTERRAARRQTWRRR